ncbi:MAG: hypothetical protein ONB27_09725 [candidate division KSB1 bacterium]|nr:hypothetical protein [candidate division KSB1 bacterium]
MRIFEGGTPLESVTGEAFSSNIAYFCSNGVAQRLLRDIYQANAIRSPVGGHHLYPYPCYRPLGRGVQFFRLVS